MRQSRFLYAVSHGIRLPASFAERKGAGQSAARLSMLKRLLHVTSYGMPSLVNVEDETGNNASVDVSGGKSWACIWKKSIC